MLFKYWLILLVLLSTLVSTASAADVTVFTSPDSSFSALSDFLEGARELKIATYTFDSTAIMDELLDTNANITIIVEKSPVGGFVGEDVLCRLAEHAEVMLYDGPYRYMHAKYIIKGGSVLVTTENFGNSFSRSQQGNRGWGIIVEDEETAEAFLDVFNEDLAHSEPFSCSLEDYEFSYEEKGNYEPVFGVDHYSSQEVKPVIAPDAVDDVLEIINSAEKSIYVEQFYVYRYWDRQTKSPNLFLEALMDKARQGLEVKILLDSYWYNVDKDDIASNFYTNQYVNEIAKNESLNLEARLADLSMIGVEKLHVKGMIVDNTAFVSSINWNENSPRNNREAGIAVSGEAAQYFVDAFMYDWSGERADYTPYTTLAIVVIIAGIVIIFIAWRKILHL
jgi:cardiolipin synthase